MMLKVTEKKLNFCEAIIVNNKQEGNFPPVFRFSELELFSLIYPATQPRPGVRFLRAFRVKRHHRLRCE